MYFNDHNPPHFHAIYGEHEAVILINNLSIRDWFLPPRVLGLVLERAMLHKGELMNNRSRMENKEEFIKISPLE